MEFKTLIILFVAILLTSCNSTVNKISPDYKYELTVEEFKVVSDTSIAPTHNIITIRKGEEVLIMKDGIVDYIITNPNIELCVIFIIGVMWGLFIGVIASLLIQ